MEVNASGQFDLSEQLTNIQLPVPQENSPDPAYAQFRDLTRFWVQRVAVPMIMVIGMFGNLITIVIMTRRRMRSTTNMYLAALAFVDMLYLMLTFILGLSHYPNMAERKYYFYWRMKPFLMMLTDACSNTSVWLTVTFTIERFIAVKYPMKGKVWCTEARAKKLILCVFAFAILFALPVPFEWKVIERQIKILTREHKNNDSNYHPKEETKTVLALDNTAFGSDETYRSIYYRLTAIMFYFLPLISVTLFNSFLIHSVHQSRKARNRMTNQQTVSVHSSAIIGNKKLASNSHDGSYDSRNSRTTNERQNCENLTYKKFVRSLLWPRANLVCPNRSNLKDKNKAMSANDKLRSKDQASSKNLVEICVDSHESYSKDVYYKEANGQDTDHSGSPFAKMKCKHRANKSDCEEVATQSETEKSLSILRTDESCHDQQTEKDFDRNIQAQNVDSCCTGNANSIMLLSSIEAISPMGPTKNDAKATTKDPSSRGCGSLSNGAMAYRQGSNSSVSITSASVSNAFATTTANANASVPIVVAAASSQERRITIMLIAVVLLFLVCQIPSAAMLLYTSVYETPPNTNEHALLLALGNIFNFLMAINAAGNFILYSFLSKKYRKTFVILFCSCFNSSSKAGNELSKQSFHQRQAQSMNNNSITVINSSNRCSKFSKSCPSNISGVGAWSKHLPSHSNSVRFMHHLTTSKQSFEGNNNKQLIQSNISVATDCSNDTIV